nr:immunoglobulin heavy chain junction region [Macaca mulatta]
CARIASSWSGNRFDVW